MQINEENLGAWVLKSNPKVWDIARVLAGDDPGITSWSVSRGYRSEMMRPGQRVLFWITGGGRAIERGFWGMGWVTGRAHDVLPADVEQEDGWWLDEAVRARIENDIRVDLPLWADPVSDAELRTAGITGLEVQVQPQRSNPSWVSLAQLEALHPYLGEWPAYVPTDAELTVSQKDGAGFGDPAQNRIVEAAAIDAVTAYYQDYGWEVLDVSAAKLGWDLTCTGRDGTSTYVEVKGVSGDTPSVLLTANELVKAADTDGWRLAIVTRALTAAHVAEYSAADVVTAARPWVSRVDLGKAAPLDG